MPYANEHSARVEDPDKYDEFARKNIAPGVDVILGIKDGKSEVQAYRFDKDKFTPEQAKKWLKDHDIKYIAFEPAKKEEGRTAQKAQKARYFNAPFGERKFEEVEDGSLRVKDVIMLAEGTWTDSNVRTPCYYSSDVLKNKFKVFENGLWARHSGGVPRSVVDKIGYFEDKGYSEKYKARMADLIFHRLTQPSRDIAEMVKNGIINYVSVEIGGEERYNPEKKVYEAQSIDCYGLAIVDKGACDVCVIRHEAEPEVETMDEEMSARFDELSAKLDKVVEAIQAIAEKLAPAEPEEEPSKEEEAEKPETSEMSKLEEEIRRLSERIAELEKTPVMKTVVRAEEEKIYL